MHCHLLSDSERGKEYFKTFRNRKSRLALSIIWLPTSPLSSNVNLIPFKSYFLKSIFLSQRRRWRHTSSNKRLLRTNALALCCIVDVMIVIVFVVITSNVAVAIECFCIEPFFSPLMQCMQCTMHKLGSSYEHVRPSVRPPRLCIVAKRFEPGSPNLVSGTTSTPKALWPEMTSPATSGRQLSAILWKIDLSFNGNNSRGLDAARQFVFIRRQASAYWIQLAFVA